MALPFPRLFDESERSGDVSERTIQTLAWTQGWTRWVAVAGFLFSAWAVIDGIMEICGGLGVLVVKPYQTDNPDLAFGMGLIPIILAAIFLVPLIKLWKFGGGIKALVACRTEADLSHALRQQHAFWKSAGLAAITLLCLLLLPLAWIGEEPSGKERKRYTPEETREILRKAKETLERVKARQEKQ